MGAAQAADLSGVVVIIAWRGGLAAPEPRGAVGVSRDRERMSCGPWMSVGAVLLLCRASEQQVATLACEYVM